MKRIKYLGIFAGLLLLFITITTTNRNEKSLVPVSYSKNTNLIDSIQKFADTNDLKPTDAVIDRVWKAIPGYNGLVVDIEKSYERMAPLNHFEERNIIFKEVSPTISLQDLGPFPIYKGNEKKEMVAFLINVAWGNEFIPPILEALEKHQVKATFFLDGSWTQKNPEIAKKLIENGHEIGSHAYSHPDLANSSEQKTRMELEKTNAVIKDTLGITPKWFGPPSGSFNQNTIDIARELNMFTVLWTVDTVDWKIPDTQTMVNRVVNEVDNGTMVLMHPTKPTAQGMEEMILGIQEKGLVIGTVTELLSEQRLESLLEERYLLPRVDLLYNW
ncbi:polysaccharide deacetylase family protein [Sporosarcina sp. Sa2YVA2]|uniref:Polysaccharide deacetylase family protein n=1 Tax=Sporosarcina quadrami TaxID=2762234 RepID=A0ABR8U5D6_9BACL|nr:polysaccharide deacetylase family protein [Sporosarcina quadrami]MBD7983262.1 polysaccharide deacetylase family protein [Sporosarcina quadrami]